jgi:hypothetical protein
MCTRELTSTRLDDTVGELMFFDTDISECHLRLAYIRVLTVALPVTKAPVRSVCGWRLISLW